MAAWDASPDDVVLAAWAPAGRGQIVVVLGQGVVIHKFVASVKAGATGIAETLAGFDTSPREREAPVADIVTARDLRASPFVEKVMRNGVPGLLASSRKKLLRWDEIITAEYRALALNRGRMAIRTGDGEHKLKVLQNTVVVGDPLKAFASRLGDRFTVPSSASP